jgi:hypothetical protein
MKQSEMDGAQAQRAAIAKALLKGMSPDNAAYGLLSSVARTGAVPALRLGDVLGLSEARAT